MHPDSNMKAVIGGKRYNVGTAKLLASNEYWDGSNFERNGRNTFLYKTRGGAYFRVALTMWQGERDYIEPLDVGEAKELFESLQEKIVEYEEAFDEVVEEATAGRPTYFGEPMKQVSVWLPQKMIDHLKGRAGQTGATMSDIMRKLIEADMQQ